jgi:hypothetical protein
LTSTQGADADWRKLREDLNGQDVAQLLSDIARDLRVKTAVNEARAPPARGHREPVSPDLPAEWFRGFGRSQYLRRHNQDRFCVGDSTVGPLNGPAQRRVVGRQRACAAICRVRKSIKGSGSGAAPESINWSAQHLL